MTKRVVILGANGQLGQALIQKSGAIDLVPLTRKDIDLAKPNISFSLKKLHFDVLINATAYNHTERAETESDLAYKINADAVLEMAGVCQEKNALFVHVSTDFVFDGKKGASYKEEDEENPLNTYGKSKLQGEKNAKLAEKHYVFRCASLYGNSNNNFVRKIIELAKVKETLHIIDEITMSPTYAVDLAAWIYQFIENQCPYGVYHAVNSNQASWYTFAKKAIELAQIKTHLIPCSANYYPSQIQRPVNSVLNNNKMAQLIGPIRSWEEALRDYIYE